MRVVPANGDSTLLAAARWLEGLVHGPMAYSLAVIAVAGVGFMMLSGRLAVRRGLLIALGCFVLFGAPTIAKGLIASARSVAGANEPSGQIIETVSPSRSPPVPAQVQTDDPYAGASVTR